MSANYGPETRERYKKMAKTMAADGYNITQIAAKLGASRSTVRAWLTQPERVSTPRQTKAEVAEAEDISVREIVEERFGTAAFDLEYEPDVRWAMQDGKPGAPGTPVFFISDWHYGEVVDPEQVLGTNRFTTAIAEQRLRHTIEMGTTLLKQHMAVAEYPGVVLILGGDMISGHLRDEDLMGSEIPPLVQVHQAAKILADAVRFLAREFKQVDVRGVPGNHGRLTRKPWAKFYAHQNLDWLCYKLVEDYCADLDNVAFHFPPVRDMTFAVAGHRYRLSHGDQFRGGDSAIGPIGPVVRGDMKKRVASSLIPGLPEAYDTLLVGHFHQLVYLPRVIINGSIKGYDEYALSINVPWEPAAQWLWTVHPKHGHTWVMPLYCDEGYSSHELRLAA